MNKKPIHGPNEDERARQLVHHFGNHLTDAANAAIVMGLNRKDFLRTARSCFNYTQRLHDQNAGTR